MRVCVGEGVCGRGLNAQQNIDLWISEIQISDFLLHVYHCSWQLEGGREGGREEGRGMRKGENNYIKEGEVKCYSVQYRPVRGCCGYVGFLPPLPLPAGTTEQRNDS